MIPPTASEAVTPGTVDRFRGDCTALLDSVPEPDAPLALAVSGGPDSMAMLALASAAFPGCVIAATVDHGLRAESADEAKMVAEWCGGAGIAHRTLTPSSPIRGSGTQAQAREARYRLLAAWAMETGALALATAHHADDQAETFLMRAVRGAGITGLRGIPARRSLGDVGAVALVRPLLGWRCDHLREIAATARLPFVDDPSNADRQYERVRVRETLAAHAWLDAAGIAGAAAHLAEADGALEEMRRWLWQNRRVDEKTEREVGLDMTGLPREMRRRLARQAIQSVRRAAGVDLPTFASATNIEPLLDSLAAGKSATQAGVLVSTEGEIWCFRPAPPRRSH